MGNFEILQDNLFLSLEVMVDYCRQYVKVWTIYNPWLLWWYLWWILYLQRISLYMMRWIASLNILIAWKLLLCCMHICVHILDYSFLVWGSIARELSYSFYCLHLIDINCKLKQWIYFLLLCLRITAGIFNVNFSLSLQCKNKLLTMCSGYVIMSNRLAFWWKNYFWLIFPCF